MKINNILAVRNDRFGEFLLNIPALRALKESFHDANLVLAVNPYVKELAESIPYVNEVFLWENRRHNWREINNFAGTLRRRKFDACVILNPTREFHVISFLAGIPIRAGYDRKCGFLLTHKIKDRKYLGDKHEVDYNLELVSLIGAKTKDLSLSLELNDGAGTKIPDTGNFLVVHPWTSDIIKQWPLESFRLLVRRIVDELGVSVVIVGGQEELEKNSGTFNGISDKITNLAGRTSLKELAVIISKSKGLISGDSGPVHLAACVDVPVIAIFRNDLPEKSPIRWGPRSKNSIVLAKNRLAEISVEDVFNKVKEVLGK